MAQQTRAQPLAIIGVGVHFPFADSVNKLVTQAAPDMQYCQQSKIWGQKFTDENIDFKAFSVPPIFRSALPVKII